VIPDPSALITKMSLIAPESEVSLRVLANANFRPSGDQADMTAVRKITDGPYDNAFPARHHPPSKTLREVVQRNVSRRAREATIGMTVTRVVDSSGNVSFAGHGYHVPRRFIRRQLDVAIVGNNMQFSIGDEVIKISPIRDDRSKEHGAFANPTGRPRKTRSA
jgi:hypothetical protein